MIRTHFFILLLSFFIVVACKPKEVTKTNNFANDTLKKYTRVDNKGEHLTMFHNMEQIEYCVWLPLEFYSHNDMLSDERAKHVFTNKMNDNYNITIQGFYLNPSIAINDYYKKINWSEFEEEGKIIYEHKLLTTKDCYYLKGYWNNNFYTERFIEIVWINNYDELIKLTANYAIEDTTLWNSYIIKMIDKMDNCN